MASSGLFSPFGAVRSPQKLVQQDASGGSPPMRVEAFARSPALPPSASASRKHGQSPVISRGDGVSARKSLYLSGAPACALSATVPRATSNSRASSMDVKCQAFDTAMDTAYVASEQTVSVPLDYFKVRIFIAKLASKQN